MTFGVINSAVKAVLAGLVILLFVGCHAPEKTQDLPPPNIVWIIAEDMGPDLSLYDIAQVKTPNIDSLAAKSMVFDKAFTTTPICSTSRSALFTGMYGTTLGAHHHRTAKADQKPLPQGVRLLMDWLKGGGYYTALIERIVPDGHPMSDIKGRGKTDWNFIYEGQAYQGSDFGALNDNQPFFAQVQFHETHRGKSWDAAHKIIETTADPQKVELPPYYPDHPIARSDWAQYLNAVMAFDKKVGVVLGQLEAQGLSENTIVFVFSDHGRAMPRGKQWLYDSGLKIPLIIHVPERYKHMSGYSSGTRSDRLISGIDLPATILSLANIQPDTDSFQGRAFLGNDISEPRQYVFGARDRAGEAADRIRSVRGPRYLYIRNYYPERPYNQQSLYKEIQYPIMRLLFRMHRDGKLTGAALDFMASSRPAEELYDTVSDPHNISNLAGNSEQQARLQTMRAELEDWIVRTDDQGRFEEKRPSLDEMRREALKKNKKKIDKITAVEGPWK